MNHEGVEVVKANANSVTVLCKTKYSCFDSELYREIRTNPQFINDIKLSSGPFADFQNCTLLMDALFKDETIRILTCAAFEIKNGYVRSLHSYDFPEEYDDYIRNYDLDRYRNLGVFEHQSKKALDNNDIDLLNSLLIACVGTMSIQDTSVIFVPAMQEIFSTNKKCIELQDGRHVTPVEALSLLKEEV